LHQTVYRNLSYFLLLNIGITVVIETTEENFKRVCVPMPLSMDNRIERAVQDGHYISKADLVRSAVRKELDAIPSEGH